MGKPIVVELSAAVATRFRAIRSGLKERAGDYIYDGSRTRPENLGWRFRQQVCRGLDAPVPAGLVAEVLAGQHDGQLEETWHDAAGAQHWYAEEKRWD